MKPVRITTRPKARTISAVLGVAISCACVNGRAAVLLSTDFSNTGISGPTMNGVSWSENGLSAPTSLSASTNLFTSGAAAAANGYFSVDQNINGSTEAAPAWTTTWTITAGGSDVELADVVLFSVEHNSTGILGGGNGTTTINLAIVDNDSTNTIADLTLTKSLSDATPEELTYTFGSPLALTAGSTYDVTFTLWEDSSSGNYEAFDSVTFNGSVIPEPSALTMVGLASLFLLRRRRR